MNFTLGWFFRLFNRVLGAGTNAYVGSLRRLTRVAALVMVVYGGLLVLTYFGFRAVPTGFIRDAGQGLPRPACSQLPDGGDARPHRRRDARMAEIAQRTPGIKYTFAIAGFNALSFVTSPTPRDVRPRSATSPERAGKPDMTSEAILGRLMGEFSQIQEGFALVFQPPAVQGPGHGGPGFKIQVRDLGGPQPAGPPDRDRAGHAAASQDPQLRNADELPGRRAAALRRTSTARRSRRRTSPSPTCSRRCRPTSGPSTSTTSTSSAARTR
jgi:multidrug efflux pump subunit AcrB